MTTDTDSISLKTPDMFGYYLDDMGLIGNGIYIGENWKIPDIIRRTWHGTNLWLTGTWEDLFYESFIVRKFSGPGYKLRRGEELDYFNPDYFDWAIVDDDSVDIWKVGELVRIGGLLCWITPKENEIEPEKHGFIAVSNRITDYKRFWVLSKRETMHEDNNTGNGGGEGTSNEVPECSNAHARADAVQEKQSAVQEPGSCP